MSSLDFRTSDEGFDDSLPDDSIDQVPATDEPDEMRPSKRQRRIPHPQHDQYEQELRPKLQKLNRLTRWNYFIEFSTEGMHEIIIAAFGEISVDSYEYSYARQKIQNWTKSWKSTSLQNMLVRYSLFLEVLLLCLTEIGVCPGREGPSKGDRWYQHYQCDQCA
jgi:hypothetical protein